MAERTENEKDAQSDASESGIEPARDEGVSPALGRFKVVVPRVARQHGMPEPPVEHGRASYSGIEPAQTEEAAPLTLGRFKFILSQIARQNGMPEPSDVHVQKVLEVIPLVITAVIERRNVGRLLTELPSGKKHLADRVLSSKKAHQDLPLPPAPPGREWPLKKYSEAHDDGLNIVQFLDDPNGWRPLIIAKLIDLKTLRRVDRSAARAINAYTKPHPKTGERRLLPPHLNIPTVKEVTNQKIKDAGGLKAALASDSSLAKTIASRIRRGGQVPGLD